MATLVLQAAGAAIGSALGGPIGAIIGRAAGALAGSAIDQRLFGGSRHVEGPRLTTLAGLAATEGSPVPRVYGRARIGGQMIWATRFNETADTTRGGASGGKSSGNASTTYRYAANFAVGLCEGKIAFVRRIWADGKELDLGNYTFRVYRGTQDQDADPLIVAKEGADHAPAYRGLAYIVFENMPLADFGNRIPQLSFEVVRPVDGLASMIRAVDLIPGSSEYAYSVRPLVQNASGFTNSENRHQIFATSDWTGSLDALQALCPNLKSVALVVSWFGDDLRAGQCTLAPRVESHAKTISGANWGVAGLSRATARMVSLVDGRPAFGGTPSDDVVVGAIQDLRARGLSVLFYPFVMMDIAKGNTLTDPVTGQAGQQPYAWRGNLTCAGADGTHAVASELAAFFGSPSLSSTEWSFRRFIQHYANLCATAGGVDAFLVGSEMRGVTCRRDDTSAFPGVFALAGLASDAKAILGTSTKISYAADWTEYGACVDGNGSDVRFPLDAIWSSPSVDFVGIDAYFPLSDWRKDAVHLDQQEADSIYDRAFLTGRVGSGEGFDWYYASEDARQAQQRSPISDGAYGKPWVFRQKDLVNWWSQPHVERVSGVERTTPTAWQPCSKPIWFVEVGCPAIDLGANAPNVFPDMKADEVELPPYSTGEGDPLMQQRALEAIITRFDPHCDGHDPKWNPVSPIYGGRMVDPERIHLWAYDARPFPAFPMLSQSWTDSPSWDTGHWLNGRLEATALDRLVQAILADLLDEPWPDLPQLEGMADGYVIDRLVSPRGALEPLAAYFGFDAIISSGTVRFLDRRKGAVTRVTRDDIVPAKDGTLIQLTRADDTDLPHELSLAFTDSEWDYRPATMLSRRLEGVTRRSSQTDIPLVTTRAQAQRAADVWLQDLWVAREAAQVTLRPGFAALEVGDLLALPLDSGERLFRISRTTDAVARSFECRAVDPSVHDHAAPVLARRVTMAPRLSGPARIEILDLAVARADPPALQFLAAFADPWPGAMSLWRSTGSGTFDFVQRIEKSAIVGQTLDDLGAGPLGIFDRANVFRVTMSGGALSSADDLDVFGGRNLLALRGAGGAWEVLGFAEAELVGAQTWRLSRLLRGIGGQDALAGRILPAGATVVLLDDSVIPLATSVNALGILTSYRIGPAARDYADDAYVEVQATAGPLALRPYAPVRPRAVRTADGVQISFLRRARRESDGWETTEIPVGEESESYVVEIIVVGDVKRSLSSMQTTVLYSSAQEMADFGSHQAMLTLRIVQVSGVVGRGMPLEASIAVH